MRVAFVTNLYPSASRPHYGTFVQQLVWEMARQGVESTVIAPTSFTQLRYGRLDPFSREEVPGPGATVRIYCPRFMSASSVRIGRFNTWTLTYRGFRKAAERVLSRIAPAVDILYGHFLYPSGRFVASAGRALNKPAFAAHGDDYISDDDLERGGRDFGGLTGIVAVSERNRRFCQEKLGFSPSDILVAPNGVDRTVFHPRDRTEMRQKLGLPPDRILVMFAGHFIERKGPDRVLEAIRPLTGVGAVMAGAGPLRLDSPQIVFKDSVPNARVAELLAACDIFVLPTTNEGCCNALLEAFACGLPVVTSKGDFNDEIVNDAVALRVDPMNIAEIRSAIATLAADPLLREKMGARALQHSLHFDLKPRARRIMDWMAEMSGQAHGIPC